MRGTDFSRSPGQSSTSATSEQARLDEAIERADDLLMASLKSDDKRRRRRTRIYLGGSIMLLAICVLLGLSWQGELARNNAAPVEESGQLAQAGWQLWQRQQFAEAATKFEQAVKLAPKNTNAWNGLGWSYFNGGDYDDAKKAFGKVITLEPKHPAALNGLGQMALLKRDYKTAETYLLKAAPQASAAWYGLARIYLLQGKYDEAKKWAKKIVDSGQADEGAKKMLEAAEAKNLSPELRRTIEPPDPAEKISADPMRGWRLFNQGRTSEAKEIFAAALEQSPDNGAALNGLGWCLLISGETAEAKPYFEKVIQAEPRAAGAMNGLARALKSEGDLDGAIKVWEQSIHVSSGATASMYGLADAYLEKEEYKKAVPLLEQLSAAQPNDETLKEKLARARKHSSAQ